jgi:hypothetical protein
MMMVSILVIQLGMIQVEWIRIMRLALRYFYASPYDRFIFPVFHLLMLSPAKLPPLHTHPAPQLRIFGNRQSFRSAFLPAPRTSPEAKRDYTWYHPNWYIHISNLPKFSHILMIFLPRRDESPGRTAGLSHTRPAGSPWRH